MKPGRPPSLGAVAALEKQLADFLVRVDDRADRHVVVDRGDEVGDILGDVDLVEPFAREQLGGTVGEVGAEHAGEEPLLVGPVELVKAVGEAPETYVTEEIYEILRINLSGLMGDKDDYLDVFVQDMVYSDPVSIVELQKECMPHFPKPLRAILPFLPVLRLCCVVR